MQPLRKPSTAKRDRNIEGGSTRGKIFPFCSELLEVSIESVVASTIDRESSAQLWQEYEEFENFCVVIAKLLSRTMNFDEFMANVKSDATTQLQVSEAQWKNWNGEIRLIYIGLYYQLCHGKLLTRINKKTVILGPQHQYAVATYKHNVLGDRHITLVRAFEGQFDLLDDQDVAETKSLPTRYCESYMLPRESQMPAWYQFYEDIIMGTTSPPSKHIAGQIYDLCLAAAIQNASAFDKLVLPMILKSDWMKRGYNSAMWASEKLVNGSVAYFLSGAEQNSENMNEEEILQRALWWQPWIMVEDSNLFFKSRYEVATRHRTSIFSVAYCALSFYALTVPNYVDSRENWQMEGELLIKGAEEFEREIFRVFAATLRIMAFKKKSDIEKKRIRFLSDATELPIAYRVLAKTVINRLEIELKEHNHRITEWKPCYVHRVVKNKTANSRELSKIIWYKTDDTRTGTPSREWTKLYQAENTELLPIDLENWVLSTLYLANLTKELTSLRKQESIAGSRHFSNFFGQVIYARKLKMDNVEFMFRINLINSECSQFGTAGLLDSPVTNVIQKAVKSWFNEIGYRNCYRKYNRSKYLALKASFLLNQRMHVDESIKDLLHVWFYIVEEKQKFFGIPHEYQLTVDGTSELWHALKTSSGILESIIMPIREAVNLHQMLPKDRLAPTYQVLLLDFLCWYVTSYAIDDKLSKHAREAQLLNVRGSEYNFAADVQNASNVFWSEKESYFEGMLMQEAPTKKKDATGKDMDRRKSFADMHTVFIPPTDPCVESTPFEIVLNARQPESTVTMRSYANFTSQEMEASGPSIELAFVHGVLNSMSTADLNGQMLYGFLLLDYTYAFLRIPFMTSLNYAYRRAAVVISNATTTGYTILETPAAIYFSVYRFVPDKSEIETTLVPIDD